jgi:hypothetical protein
LSSKTYLIFSRSAANLTAADNAKYLKFGWDPPIDDELPNTGLLPSDLVYIYTEDPEQSKKNENQILEDHAQDL